MRGLAISLLISCAGGAAADSAYGGVGPVSSSKARSLDLIGAKMASFNSCTIGDRVAGNGRIVAVDGNYVSINFPYSSFGATKGSLIVTAARPKALPIEGHYKDRVKNIHKLLDSGFFVKNTIYKIDGFDVYSSGNFIELISKRRDVYIECWNPEYIGSMDTAICRGIIFRDSSRFIAEIEFPNAMFVNSMSVVEVARAALRDLSHACGAAK